MVNSPNGKFCIRCRTPLNQETAMKIEEKRKDMDGAMATLLKDPEVLSLIASKIKQMSIQV